jgi:hypothetical protein
VKYSQVRLCSGKGAFEAIPSRRARVDLPAIRDLLQATGREVVDARVMLIIRGQPEITIAADGRLVFKTQDAGEAQRAFQGILALLEGFRERPGRDSSGF